MDPKLDERLAVELGPELVDAELGPELFTDRRPQAGIRNDPSQAGDVEGVILIRRGHRLGVEGVPRIALEVPQLRARGG